MISKILKKIFFVVILCIPSIAMASDYILYYWQWCSHCAKVEKYMKDNDIDNIEKKEIYFDNENRTDFLDITEKLWIKTEDVWVPFLYIKDELWDENYLIWDKPIIELFKNDYIKEDKDVEIINSDNKDKLDFNPWKFLLILFPAALSDSINPCAFAVILILLWAVLSKFKSRRKVIMTWLSFSFAIFLSYLLMGLWLYNVLWNIESIFYFKLAVGIIGIIIWLANLKDAFWYWKGFVMEVPFSWRPKMKKIIKKATSPMGWFVIWLIVSLFLLPCTSWPYVTVLWYLAAESQSIQAWWYMYLVIYNIIFILPMVIITVIIAYWYMSVAMLMEIKEEKTELIHLIVWILMLLLWSYVIWDSFI